jgi:hypothetical protein
VAGNGPTAYDDSGLVSSLSRGTLPALTAATWKSKAGMCASGANMGTQPTPSEEACKRWCDTNTGNFNFGAPDCEEDKIPRKGRRLTAANVVGGEAPDPLLLALHMRPQGQLRPLDTPAPAPYGFRRLGYPTPPFGDSRRRTCQLGFRPFGCNAYQFTSSTDEIKRCQLLTAARRQFIGTAPGDIEINPLRFVVGTGGATKEGVYSAQCVWKDRLAYVNASRGLDSEGWRRSLGFLCDNRAHLLGRLTLPTTVTGRAGEQLCREWCKTGCGGASCRVAQQQPGAPWRTSRNKDEICDSYEFTYEGDRKPGTCVLFARNPVRGEGPVLTKDQASGAGNIKSETLGRPAAGQARITTCARTDRVNAKFTGTAVVGLTNPRSPGFYTSHWHLIWMYPVFAFFGWLFLLNFFLMARDWRRCRSFASAAAALTRWHPQSVLWDGRSWFMASLTTLALMIWFPIHMSKHTSMYWSPPGPAARTGSYPMPVPLASGGCSDCDQWFNAAHPLCLDALCTNLVALVSTVLALCAAHEHY